jgi:hypothetical protein
MINFVIIVSQKKIWNQIFYLITNQGLDVLIRSLLMVIINNEVIDFLIYSVDNHQISYSSDYQDKFDYTIFIQIRLVIKMYFSLISEHLTEKLNLILCY